ncbi:MAG TPA: Hpt domain-containing protein [Ramlibacter sp.]|uniref:Hpt domain-containing protein n=1 Tax=Ramlibacter sp. TaxID=1917967 RepID=UPI002C85F643|nr:Hpt domain-containing protein [Ramlibacter sp.]HVZ42959.1 Hpt domain-containing protein [Ramlibacter sp.]
MSISREELMRRIEAGRVEYARSLPAKVAHIEALVGPARTSADALRELERAAHSLYGTAGTYGFRELGNAARAVEEAASAMVAGEDRPLALAHAVDALRSFLPSGQD